MKTTLEVNGNNGTGISFEQVKFNDLMIDSEDEMHGDQLLGHPAMIEIEKLRGRKVFTVDVEDASKKDIRKKIKDIIKKIRK